MKVGALRNGESPARPSMQGILRSVKTRWINPEDMSVSLTGAEATGAAARSSTKLLPKLTVPLQSLVRVLRTESVVLL